MPLLLNKKVIILSILLTMLLALTTKSQNGADADSNGAETDTSEIKFIFVDSFFSEKNKTDQLSMHGANLLTLDLQELCREFSKKKKIKIKLLDIGERFAIQHLVEGVSRIGSGGITLLSDSSMKFFKGLQLEGTHFGISSEFTKDFIGKKSQVKSRIYNLRIEGNKLYYTEASKDPVFHRFDYEIKEDGIPDVDADVLVPLAMKLASALDFDCKEPEVPVLYIYPMELECYPKSLLTRMSGLPAKLMKKLVTGEKGRIRTAENDSMTNVHLKVTVFDMMKETEITANIWLSNEMIIASGIENYPSNSYSDFSEAINSIVKNLLKELESRNRHK